MTEPQIKAMRRIVTRNGVSIMFGQRPFDIDQPLSIKLTLPNYGNNQQAVAVVVNGDFDAAHAQCLDVERRHGLEVVAP
jgi:sulfur carrier protein ThiS